MVGDTGELAERFASGDRGGAAKKLVIEFTPVGMVDMPPAPIDKAVTAHSHLLLLLPLTGERLLFTGQKSRRPRSKRMRASASIFSFP